MRKPLFTAILVGLHVILFIVPSAFFIAPQPVHAIGGLPVVEIGGSLFANIITSIKTTLSLTEETMTAIKTAYIAVKAAISAAADVANQVSLNLLVVDKYVIKPLAFILSGNLLKMMTSSVISFAIGKTNGTGAPQFVQNINGALQGVGDKQASVFLLQLGKTPNSPFAASIASSLRVNYLQQTSAAGFFAANKNTLAQSSPSINAFLGGNWSQGGVRTWFALTTQCQNNPYCFYQESQNQLAKLAATAQSATSKQLDYGKGFFSWCGANKGSGSSAAGVGGAPPNCTKADGSSGIILTPGPLITNAVLQGLDTERQKLIPAGEAGKEINSIFSNIKAAFDAVSSGIKLLGGVGNAFGFAGAAQSSGTTRSVLEGLGTSFLGASTSNVINSGAAINGGDLASRISRYQKALSAATAAIAQAQANTATPAACPSNASSTPMDADSSSQIQVALAEVAQGQQILANAKVVLAEANAHPDSSGDLPSLDGVAPTGEDIATMEQIPGQMAAISAGVTHATCIPSQAP